MTPWRRPEGVSVLAYGFPGMPMGAGVNSEGIALCWTSAALGDERQLPRVGIPSYVFIAPLLAQKDLDSVIREVRKNRHAGWFTFVMADGDGRLVNIEGSPERIVVEQAKDRLVRVGDATIDMMVFDTTARSAFLSRGSSYGLSWREFVFGAELRSRRDSTFP